MKPSKPLLLFLLIGLTATLFAQDYNPYEGIGKKAKVLTASHGKYVEVFDYDSIQRIGSVLFNIYTKKIIRLLDADKIFLKYSNNSSSSRWFSPDPLSEKYYSWSPYNYAANNPIKNIDVHGDSLRVATDPMDTKSQDQFVSTVNAGLGGFYTVNTYENEDGTTGMTLVANKDAQGEMTDKQKEFYNAVKDAFNGDGQVKIALDNGDTRYILGDNGRGRIQSIDMADQKALDKGSMGLVSSIGGVGHEINEAYQTQIQGVSPTVAHINSIGVENKIDGSTRIENPNTVGNTFSRQTGSGTINEEYKKGGVTYIVSYIIVNNNIKDIQVTKKN